MKSTHLLGTYTREDRHYLYSCMDKYSKRPLDNYLQLYGEVIYETSPVLDSELFEEVRKILFTSIVDQAIELAVKPDIKFPRDDSKIGCYLYNQGELESFMKYFNRYHGDIKNLNCCIIFDNYHDFFCFEISNKKHYKMYKDRFFSGICEEEYSYTVRTLELK